MDSSQSFNNNSSGHRVNLVARAIPVLLMLIWLGTLAGLINAVVTPSLYNPVFWIYSFPKLAFIISQAFVLLVIWFLCKWMLGKVAEESYLSALERWIVRVDRPWLGILLGFTLILFVLLCSGVFFTYYPHILWILPIVLFYIGGIFILLLVVTWHRLSHWIERTQPIWASLGITISCIAGMALLVYFLNLPFLRSVFDSLFEAPSTVAFTSAEVLQENPWHRAGSSRWLPFMYYRSSFFEGKYYNIEKNGLRNTSQFVAEGTENIKNVYVFGGSTVWGVGVRDDHTIPSFLSRLLNEEYGKNVVVTSFAEQGYVSTQDLILFLRQLQMGHRPDIAIFIQGFNEVAASWTSGYAGIPCQELNRVKDFNLGRSLFYGALERQRGLMPDGLMTLYPTVLLPQFLNSGSFSPKLQESVPDLDMSLISKGGSAKDVVDMYLENIRAVQILSKAYDIQPLFVWQPTPFVAKPLADYEKRAVEEIRRIFPDAQQLFKDTDTEIRSRIEEQPIEGFLELSRLFENDRDIRYIDEAHYTTEGNQQIALKIAPMVVDLLSGNETR